MALGRRKRVQDELFIAHDRLPVGPGNSFYERLNGILTKHDFDGWCEEHCRRFYTEKMGRPSLVPGVYFRMVLLGYFERISSERQIAWRVADSLSLRRFLGLELTDRTPDHSTLSRTRQRLDQSVHEEVFAWVLKVLAQEGLVKGQTLGVDGTTLEANASLRALRDKVTNESYQSYVRGLMGADPEVEIDDPGPDDIARYDRRRKDKKLSNTQWHNPHNPDAQITRMKDGRTHFAEKCEHAVDMETGAVLGVTVQPASRGDTESIYPTLVAAARNLNQIKPEIRAQLKDQPQKPGRPLPTDLLAEVVADKGYHSASVITTLQQRIGIRTVISEPDRGRQKWKDRHDEQQAVYRNRTHIRQKRGKNLLKRRGELLERAFTHYLDLGSMRKLFLKGHQNITKRLLIHVAGFNLGLLMRKLFHAATPRAAAAAANRFFAPILALFAFLACQHPPSLHSCSRRQSQSMIKT